MRLDHTDTDSISKCVNSTKAVLIGLRNNLQKGAARYNRVSPQSLDAMSVSTEPNADDGLDVRLVSNADGELWFATGDVGYDTVHDTVHVAACESITLNPNDDDDALDAMAADLVNGVANRLADIVE
jgi:hypothetical protein